MRKMPNFSTKQSSDEPTRSYADPYDGDAWVRQQMENIRRRAEDQAEIWKNRQEAVQRLMPPPKPTY